MNGVQEEKMNLEICHFIKQAIGICIVHHEIVNTIDRFAEACNITTDRLKNIMDGRTPPSFGLFLTIQYKLKEYSPYAYSFLKHQLFPEY